MFASFGLEKIKRVFCQRARVDAAGYGRRTAGQNACILLTVMAVMAMYGSGERGALAQFIQLPTVRTFSVETAVSVPDRGSISPAGIGYTVDRSGRLNRSAIRAVPVRGAAVAIHTIIHDLAARDAALLAEAQFRRQVELPILAPTDPNTLAARRMTRTIRSTAAELRQTQSVSVLQRQRNRKRSVAQFNEQREARILLSHGTACESRGDHRTAQMFYRRAHKLGRDETKQQASERLAAISRMKDTGAGDEARSRQDRASNLAEPRPKKTTSP